MNNYGYGCDGSEPYFNEPDPPECANMRCCATLDDDWRFCPYCGTERDDWQADEYRNEVH